MTTTALTPDADRTTGTPTATPTAGARLDVPLPVHPRRSGWRAGAAAALVVFAVSRLQAGRDPHRDVRALAELGRADTGRGLVAAEELDRRLVLAAADLADELLLRRARAAVYDAPAPGANLLDLEAADALLAPLFDRLDAAAVAGRPHPGEWVASSVDVVPCAVHGYEDGPVDCLRRTVRDHLVGLVEDVAEGRSVSGSLAGAVRAAGRHPGTDHLDDPAVGPLWVGVAALAAWQAHAATR